MNAATTTATMTTKTEFPAHVSYFRLAQMKGALKLEKVGMKGRQGALRPQIAKELGLKPRDTYDTYIAVIQAKMNEMLAAQEAAQAIAIAAVQ